MRDAALLVFTCCCSIAWSACGTHIPLPTGGPRGAPGVSWVVMAGDRDNPDAQFVCQSEPRTDCVLTVSRPNALVWASLYVYYRAASEEIRYTGSIRIGFFEGPATESHEVRPDILVKPNDVMHQSVVDDVTATPGTYRVTFDVIATTRAGAIQPMRDTVTVVVR